MKFNDNDDSVFHKFKSTTSTSDAYRQIHLLDHFLGGKIKTSDIFRTIPKINILV